MSTSRRCILWALAVGGFDVVTTAAPDQECALDAHANGLGTAVQTPSILTAWKLKYPTSTIPSRTETLTGLDCYICHDPAGFSADGNCYRSDLAELILGGSTVQDALDALDGVDSDGDGYTNGVEATAPRPGSSDIGYNMGLVGDTGTNPCGPTPEVPITGVAETPPRPIPTASEWGLLIMGALVLAAGITILARRSRHAT